MKNQPTQFIPKSPSILAARDQCSPVREARPVGQAGEQSMNIRSAIDRLEKIASMLRERLNDVTAQREDAKPPSPCPPDAVIVQFADDLRNHQRRINGIADNLENLLSNIEL